MIYNFNEDFDRIASEKWTYDSVVNGCKVMPMGVADMDLISPVEVREALMSVCRRREYGYPAYHDDYKQVLASWFDHYYNWRPAEEWLVETPGLLMTMGAFIRDLTAPDEKVVIMTPVYHAFAKTVRANHREVFECDLLHDEDNHYTIDFDALKAACADPKNKFLIFCNPHNPVGRCWTEAEVKQVIEIAQSTGTLLISDEIHGDFTFDGRQYTPVLKAASDPTGIIVFSSGGKLFNIGGIFSAFIISGDPAIRQQISICVSELHWQPTAFAHEAPYAGFKYGHDYKRQLLEHVRKMQIRFVDGLNSMPYPVRANLPEATYLVWADFSPTGWSADRIVDFLVRDAAIGFNRGDSFGMAGARFARCNLAVCQARVDEALNRLNDAFAHYF